MDLMRTDIHRPAEIVPTDYEFVAFRYLGGSDLGAILTNRHERELFEAHQKKTGGAWARTEHAGICHVCGQGNVSYVSDFYHAETNTYVRLGWQCAMKLELAMDGRDPEAFRAQIRAARVRQAGKVKAQAVLEDQGINLAWSVYLGGKDPLPFEEQVITDIVAKLIQYGSISEKQSKFLASLLERIEQREELEAKRAEERANVETAPTGRVMVEGEVLKIKAYHDDFYPSKIAALKMIVKTDAGWRVWCSVPTSIMFVNDALHHTGASRPAAR